MIALTVDVIRIFTVVVVVAAIVTIAARLTPKEYSDAEKQHVLREHIAAHVRFGGA